MAAAEIHTASPISGDSSNEDLIKQKIVVKDKPLRPSAGRADSSWSMFQVKSEPLDTDVIDLKRAVTQEITSPRRLSPTDTIVEDISFLPKSDNQVPTQQTTTPPADTQPTINLIKNFSTPNYTSPPRKSVTRIHTRNTSISATMDLPWNIDNTSSPTPISHARNESLILAPPPKASETNRATNSDRNSISDSPKLHPLMKRAAQSQRSISPSPYAHSSTRQAPSPYASYFSAISQQQNQNQNQQTHSLTSPPGYTQNTHASFSTTTTNSTGTSHSNSPPHRTTLPSLTTTSTTISRPSSFSSTTSSSYSPLDKSAPTLYTTTSTPFYPTPNQTNTTNYNDNTFFSPTFSFTSPKTPSKTPTRAGILDNDPSIYLQPDPHDTGSVDDGNIWDTATKWARMASKQFSMSKDRGPSTPNSNGGGNGGREFSVGTGLWRMVAGEGAERKGGY